MLSAFGCILRFESLHVMSGRLQEACSKCNPYSDPYRTGACAQERAYSGRRLAVPPTPVQHRKLQRHSEQRLLQRHANMKQVAPAGIQAAVRSRGGWYQKPQLAETTPGLLN